MSAPNYSVQCFLSPDGIFPVGGDVNTNILFAGMWGFNPADTGLGAYSPITCYFPVALIDGIVGNSNGENWLGTIAFNGVYDGTNWYGLGGIRLDVDGLDPIASGLGAITGSVLMLTDGDELFDRARSNSTTNLTSATQSFAQMVAAPGEWSEEHSPAADTIASITIGAGAGTQAHVLRSINASICAVAAIAAPLKVVVREGATGVGTIIWSDRLIAPIGTSNRVTLSDLNIVIPAATALTVEFTGAPGATNFETIAITGYTTE